MDLKRKAVSPCESEKKDRRNISPESSFNDWLEKKRYSTESSFESCETESEEEMSTVSNLKIRVTQRNGEDFKGGLNYVQSFVIWSEGLKLPEPWLYGISLTQSKDRPFLVDFRLNCQLETDKILKVFKVQIDGATYLCEYVPDQDPPAKIGEFAKVTIKNTKWKLTPDQVKSWLAIYGEVVKGPEFEDAPGLTRIKADHMSCTVKLARHIPNLLPAYGRRMNVIYSGQPMQCGKCFGFDHQRSKCTSEEPADWLKDYVPQFYGNENVSSMMLGRWFDLLKTQL